MTILRTGAATCDASTSEAGAHSNRQARLELVPARHLARPREVVFFALVREVRGLDVGLEVPGKVIGRRGIQKERRGFIQLEARNAAEVLRHRSLGAVVAGQAGLELLVLVPENDVGLLRGV